MSIITEYIVPLSFEGKPLGRATAEFKSVRPLPKDFLLVDQLIAIVYHTSQLFLLDQSDERRGKEIRDNIKLLIEAENSIRKALGITDLKVRFLSAEAARNHKLYPY